MLSLSIVYLHSIRKESRRHYSLSGFTLRSISVSALCQRCERILAQDDFTWSSLHLHPYPLSFTPSLSLIHCIPFTIFHSLHLHPSFSVCQSHSHPAVSLSFSFHPTLSVSDSFITFNSISLLSLSLSPLYYQSVSNASFYYTCVFCQHCFDSHTQLQTSRPGSCPVCVQCLACWHLDGTC